MLKNYFKIALRNLRTQRSYTLLNVTGLAVGMAGALLVFLFVKHHLSTDRHHAKFERIFRIVTDVHLEDGSIEYDPEAPMPMAEALRTEYPQVEQAAFLMMLRELTVGVEQPENNAPRRFREKQGVGLAEPEWFEIMDYTWLSGNPKTALSEPGRIVLTKSQAKRYFGAADPMGRTLTLNNKVRATVTGLIADPPPTTDTPLDLFVSLPTLRQLDPEYDMTDWYWLNSTNRLYVTLKEPNAGPELERAFPALAKKHYSHDASIFQFHVQPLRQVHFDVARSGNSIRASLLWSLGTVGLLLIVAACINFINLATAQALRRGKEVGIRKTLGSTRGQLVRQFMLETTLIAVTATLLAVLLVVLALPIFNDWAQLPLTLRLDLPNMGFVSLLLLATILLAGGYPALVLSGFSPHLALRGSLATSVWNSFNVRRLLIVTQFAVCQALIIGALVVANQIRYIQQTDLGFRKDNVVLVSLPYGQKSGQEAFKQQLLPYADIQSVSLTVLPPSSSVGYGGSFKFDGNPEWSKFPVRERLADADYLDTYGMKLLAGRNITPGDTIREYLINETLLHKLGFKNPKEVLGKKLQYYLSPVPLSIVGVVADFHQKSLREKIEPIFIASKADSYRLAGIRISGNNPIRTLERIRETWQKTFPDEVFEYQFLDEQLARFYETETLTARLINLFTGIAILICCLGLYGLISFVVVQRTKEIGVRKVLGASVASIVALLSKDFLKLVLIAIIIASPLAWYAMRAWLADFAYKIDIEWWYFALAGGLAVGIALLTVSFQSVKAALMNPVESLRSE
ncbi:ABC transporter permease [Persicitalea sp.]|uniref:ABC transporter permease n=1 Tax=Persicitalea sp. TaxID=3100273 RepID=UPI0035947B92